MAVDGHQRSVPIRMRPWETRVATHRGREANRRTVGGRDGATCRSARGLLALRLPATRPGVPGGSRVGLRQRPGVPAARHGRLRLRRPGLFRPLLRGPEDPVRDPRSLLITGPVTGTAAGTPGHRGTSGEPATGRRAAFPDTRSLRSVIPPRQLIRDPATRRPATRPLAASPSRSRRRPAAAMRSCRSLGPSRPCPTRGVRGDGRSPERGVPGGSSPGRTTAYPEQWYDNPRLDDRVLGDSNQSRSADPRLAGMTYGELRYDDPEPGASGYDEPLDDESWFKELRRSTPAYPQSPGGPQGPGSGPQRRAEPSGPAFGQKGGLPQAPDRASGYGQPRRDGSGRRPRRARRVRR